MKMPDYNPKIREYIIAKLPYEPKFTLNGEFIFVGKRIILSFAIKKDTISLNKIKKQYENGSYDEGIKTLKGSEEYRNFLRLCKLKEKSDVVCVGVYPRSIRKFANLICPNVISKYYKIDIRDAGNWGAIQKFNNKAHKLQDIKKLIKDRGQIPIVPRVVIDTAAIPSYFLKEYYLGLLTALRNITNEKLIDDKQYERVLEMLKAMSMKLDKHELLSDKDVRLMNESNICLNDKGVDKNAFVEFINVAIDELTKSLVKNNLVGQCNNEKCKKVILYKKGKKFCAQAVEHKDCATTVRNKRYYKKNWRKLLPRKRVSTNGLREVHKKYAVKK